MPKYLALFFVALESCLAAGVIARFDPSSIQTGPFPADSLTVPDGAQLTGKHVNLPLPDCSTAASLCGMLAQINQLDGFNVRPRIAVTFSGPIDTSTLRAGIFVVALGSVRKGEAGLQYPGDHVAINQVTYDPVTNTAYAKPDAVLDQHRRYALVVTDAVRDPAGVPVSADPNFISCTQTSGAGAYCTELARAVNVVKGQSLSGNVISASVFTTLSATSWLESARRQLNAMPVVVRHPDGQFVFKVPDLAGLTINFDTGSGNFSSYSVPITDPGYSQIISSIGRVAFGSYLSPLVVNSRQTIDLTPTRVPVSLPTPLNEVAFHVYLPNSPPPPNGYPVVIFGHGFGDSSIGAPTIVAPALAQAGFATIAINAFGHGYGPRSNLVLTGANGAANTISLGGRGVDADGNGTIDSSEGCLVITPLPVGVRDCIRQTTIDLMQLVRAVQAGLDVDGDGSADLDRARIYYAGQSLGAIYGTVFAAVEPGIHAAALNVGGGSVLDIVRWSPAFESTSAAILTSQTPPLLPPGTQFSDNLPFRDQPVSLNGPGQSQTGYFLELIEWLGNAGDPMMFAPHLARAPLRGVGSKSILFQFARADRTVPNPAATNLIRAAGMTGSTWLYRHDLAMAMYPGQLPQDPHPYLALFLSQTGGTVNLPSLPALLIGAATQSQLAGFFASDGAVIPDMNQILPGPLFEIPTSLPNDLGYSN